MKKIVLLFFLLYATGSYAQIPTIFVVDLAGNERTFSLKELRKIEPEKKTLRFVSQESKTLARYGYSELNLIRFGEVGELLSLQSPGVSISEIKCYVEDDLLVLHYSTQQSGNAAILLLGVDGTPYLKIENQSFVPGDNKWIVSLSDLQILKGSLLIGRVDTSEEQRVFRFIY